MGFKPSFDETKGRIKVLVRLSYFKGFSKTASTEGGKLKYRTNGLVSKSTPEGKAQKAVINEGIVDIIGKTWPGKDPKKMKEALGDHPKGRWPLLDGDKYVNDDGDTREGYEDQFFLKLTNDKKPKFKNRRGEDIDQEEADDLFRSGYWAIAYFHLYAIKDQAKGGNGIFATLDALQFYKRDEEFAGGGIDDDEIDDYGDEDEDDDFDNKSKGKSTSKGSGKRPSLDDDDDI